MSDVIGILCQHVLMLSLLSVHVKLRSVVTFPNPLVLYLSTGDLIGLSLLILLQLLGVLHFLPLRLVQVALQIHK